MWRRYNASAASEHSDVIDPAIRASNLEALSRAMVYMTVIPWGLCLVLYTALHFTYRYTIPCVHVLFCVHMQASVPEPHSNGFCDFPCQYTE
jgi:hypothetical protein